MFDEKGFVVGAPNIYQREDLVAFISEKAVVLTAVLHTFTIERQFRLFVASNSSA